MAVPAVVFFHSVFGQSLLMKHDWIRVPPSGHWQSLAS